MKRNIKDKPLLGGLRPVIDSVKPEINSGRYPVKRILGDLVRIEATVVLDGHDFLSCNLLYKHRKSKSWTRIPMVPAKQGKDCWEAFFKAGLIGEYLYTVEASLDRFGTWRSELEKKYLAKQDVSVELQEGEILLREALKRIAPRERSVIKNLLGTLADRRVPVSKKVRTAIKPEFLKLIARYPDTARSVRYGRELRITVDREAAAFSAWYEFFPRSSSKKPGVHGTFKDAEGLLPYVAELGFDVVYLPPIHPIGFAFRKGKNNSLEPSPEDPGSPWGIGASSGGHKAIHPELGTMQDFSRFLRRAESLGLEVALDIAFQCSPDHPYVKSHPEWFRQRPDGTIQYAENPPKKYQDIYPFYFETEQWPELWDELKDIVLFWVRQGVKIFRVDNPHTKPVLFWEWLIREVKTAHPEVLFLSEAFTRPSMMYLLAKAGFTQSYTYFTWRNTPAEFKKYLEELTQTEVAEYYKPNFWPNTPDILPIHLQTGGRPAFLARVALASTLSSTYGIYGPAYEHCIADPYKEGGEEYADAEKYEIKTWDLNAKHSIRDFISKLNRIRKKNPALRRNQSIRFHPVDNDKIVCFSKQTPDLSNIVLVVVNLDFAKTQSGTFELPLSHFGIDSNEAYVMTDLLARFSTDIKGPRRRIRLNPAINPVAIFRIEK